MPGTPLPINAVAVFMLTEKYFKTGCSNPYIGLPPIIFSG